MVVLVQKMFGFSLLINWARNQLAKLFTFWLSPRWFISTILTLIPITQQNPNRRKNRNISTLMGSIDEKLQVENLIVLSLFERISLFLLTFPARTVQILSSFMQKHSCIICVLLWLSTKDSITCEFPSSL